MRGSITDVPSDTTYWVTSSDDEEYQNAFRDFNQPIDDEDYPDERVVFIEPINDENAFLDFQTDGTELDVAPNQNNIEDDERNEQAEDLLYFYIDDQQDPQSNVNIIEMLEAVNKVDLTEVYGASHNCDENIEHCDGPDDSNDGDALD